MENHKKKAACLYKEILEGHVLGSQHPDTLTSSGSLGMCTVLGGDLYGGIAQWRRPWLASQSISVQNICGRVIGSARCGASIKYESGKFKTYAQVIGVQSQPELKIKIQYRVKC